MDSTAVRSVDVLPELCSRDDSLERIASELQIPLDALSVSTEWLLQQLREERGDPTDISAAETLLHSVERMNRLVQALQDMNRSQGF